MSIRKTAFVKDEIYHCYNRGVDKRVIFQNSADFAYFLDALYFLNDQSDIYRMRERKLYDLVEIDKKHVKILAYCLNPNHFHLLLTPCTDSGLSKFMQKVSTSYTMYFNQRYKRSGSLFQGKFKCRHVADDLYFQHLSVYVAMNNYVHGITDTSKYRSNFQSLCNKIPNQISDPNDLSKITDFREPFEKFAKKKLPTILQQKELERELKNSVYID